MSSPVQGDRQSPPDWAAISPEPTPRSAFAGTAIRTGAGVGIVAVLWATNRTLPAVLLGAGLVLAAALSLRVPAAARAMDRFTKAIQHATGQVLTFVLLALFELVVFAPLSGVLKVLRIDPLEVARPVEPGSLWRAAAQRPARPLYRHQFAYERGPGTSPAPASRARRLRSAAAVFAVLVLLDVAVGALIHAGDSQSADTATQHLSLLASAGVPAARHEPWLPALGLELGHEYYTQRPDPYLVWRMPDYRSRYVNVQRGRRDSWQGPLSRSPRAVQVFFFGGSALFGVFQRDAYTIPSDVARMAAAANIPVRVWNFGAIGYVNWQEVLQFEQLLAGGSIPGLAVFYDGANELLGQFRLGLHTTPSHAEARAIADALPYAGVTPPRSGETGGPLRALYRAWTHESAINWLLRGGAKATSLALPPWAVDQGRAAGAAGADAAVVYRRGVDLATRVAAAYGVRSAFFWQPIYYSKRKLAGELAPEDLLGTDPAAWTRAYGVASGRLRPPVTNLATSLNGAAGPVMLDFVHTNEVGARIVSRAMFARLEPLLRTLARRGRR